MRKTKNPLLVFTGGGTGGHVYPGLAVIDELEAANFFDGRRLCWLGSSRGMEGEIIRRRGIEFVSIPSGKLRRYFSFQNLIDLFKVGWGLCVSLAFMLKNRPVLLFSKGGYVSVPPVIAARLCGIPVLTHESDFDPGLATRINARFATYICLSYAETEAFFPPAQRSRIVVTGNPIRREIRAGNPKRGRDYFGLRSGRPLVLVLGGSLGARQINEMLAAVRDELLVVADIVHQTGGGNDGASPAAGYVSIEYIDESMADILSAADLIIARAGAGTLWECASAGKAMLLVPLDSNGSRGDQLRNAAYFESVGAAEVLRGDDASAQTLAVRAKALIESPARRKALGEAAAALAQKNGAREAAGLIRTVLDMEA